MEQQGCVLWLAILPSPRVGGSCVRRKGSIQGERGAVKNADVRELFLQIGEFRGRGRVTDEKGEGRQGLQMRNIQRCEGSDC